MIEDLFPAYVWPDTAGDAAEEVFEAGAREAFLPIFLATANIRLNTETPCRKEVRYRAATIL